MRQRLPFPALATAALGLSAGVAAAASLYTPRPAVSPDDGSPITALAINDNGELAGHTGLASDVQVPAFVKTSKGYSLVQEGTNPFATATGLNKGGTMVGVSTTDRGYDHAIYRWNGGTQTFDLFPNAPDNFSEAYGINDKNTMVGTYRATSSTPAAAFRYSNGSFTWLGHLGCGQSVAMAINNKNRIVGYSCDKGGVRRAFKWTTKLVQLPSLTTVGKDTAYAINDLGGIVGQCGTTTGSTACKWTGDPAVVRDLGGLGGTSAAAYGINYTATIVGTATDTQGLARAVVFENGAAVDLNGQLTAGVASRLTQAVAIDMAGVILAIDVLGNSYYLTPQ